MTIRIDLLTPDGESEYEELARSLDSVLFYASLPYRRFLQTLLPQSRAAYLTAWEAGRMIGALPAFLSPPSPSGIVLNSLPFYGSNGGVLVSPRYPDAKATVLELLRAFDELALQEKTAASTLISNPLDPLRGLYREEYFCDAIDERIGQITPLPRNIAGEEEREQAVMEQVHQKTRNCIRKAMKSGLSIRHSGELAAMENLYRLHKTNMEAIGGLAKPWEAFAAIREAFAYDQDYRIYIAEKDGETIASLLVFFYNRTAEYYTPASSAEHRVLQPMSLLIFEAMLEAMRRGLHHWNWGGTWLTQDGVYHFKKRWGTEDIPYYYYVRIYDESLRRLSKETLLREFPYFYVMPFRMLMPSSNNNAI
ncbi:MAG: GNAT family N-acetyltransferase [Candidatus Omnitrophota bacterium]